MVKQTRNSGRMTKINDNINTVVTSSETVKVLILTSSTITSNINPSSAFHFCLQYS